MSLELSEIPDDLQELRPLEIREKIAFLIYDREVLFQIEPVLQLLGPEQVDLIVYSVLDQARIEARVAELPFAWYEGRDLVRSRIGYRLLVSSHAGGLEDVQITFQSGRQLAYQGFPLRMLGVFNIRFMYCLGADYWNYRNWNHLYDAFFCYGPHHVQRLAAFPGLKFQMGYPRYDSYFTQPLSSAAKARWLAHFNCDPTKPVLLWFLPLLNYYPGLETFSAILGRLRQHYNLIVKPHPNGNASEQAFIAGIDKSPFTAWISESIDNVILYQLADFVISEYGGTLYGALYTDRNLLLFDHPEYGGIASEDLLASDTDQWMRRHIVHLPPDQAEQLPALLQDSDLWQEQQAVRAWLRELFFAPTYGYSAQVATKLLRQLLQLARRPA